MALEMDELELVSAARVGDRDAQRVLVEQHGPVVLALCRRLAVDPEDAFQDIWVRIFRALTHYDLSRPPRLRAWILTVAHRHLIDRHRKRTRRGIAVPFDDRTADVRPRPDESLARRRRALRLHQAIEALSPDQRRAVVLHHLAGTPLVDIAGAEGVGVNTIKSRLHRGRARLALLLRGQQ